MARWRDRWAGWPRRLGRLDSVARRGVAYVLACWAIPVGNATCLTGGKLDCHDAQRPAHGARPRMGFCEPDYPV